MDNSMMSFLTLEEIFSLAVHLREKRQLIYNSKLAFVFISLVSVMC